MRKLSARWFLLLAFTLAGSRAVAQVLVVNIDFNQTVGTYSGQGAYSDPGHNFWNGVTSTAGGSNFTASDGTTATTISASFSNVAGLGYGGVPTLAPNLLADYLYVYTGATVTFTISGLTAGASYDFYFYSVAGGSNTTDRSADFTFNGTTRNVTGRNVASFTEGTNYLRFSVTPSGTSLSGSFAVAAGNSEAELNGIQIVQLTAVPEPSTYAATAGALALAGAIVVRRRGRGTAVRGS
jgi:hypothetical protein